MPSWAAAVGRSDALCVALRINTTLTLCLTVPQDGKAHQTRVSGSDFYEKMTTAEKIKQSACAETFTLYKEGMFYKCYNEDAMVFSRHIKAYHISVKHVKNTGSDVLSLGFPESEVTRGKLPLDHISEALGAGNYSVEEKQVVFRLKEDMKQDYAGWCKNHSVREKPGPDDGPSSPSSGKIRALLSDIKTFDLANSTPMQGLQFIQELKQKVQNMQ